MLGAPLRASAQSSPKVKATAATIGMFDCGGGISVRVIPASAAQGSLLRLEVRGNAALADVTGKWTQRELPRAVPFWTDPKSPGTFHGFLGVDLEKPPGKYDLILSVERPDSKPVLCKTVISVAAGKFAVEKLNVAPQFVEPIPEETKRANEDAIVRAQFLPLSHPRNCGGERFGCRYPAFTRRRTLAAAAF